MQGKRDSEPMVSPLSKFTGTIYTPAWMVVVCWLNVPLFVSGILLFLVMALAALSSRAWGAGCLLLLVVLVQSYTLARTVPALLTMHWRVDVTLEGVQVHRGKGASSFTPWSKFGVVRDPWPWVRRYYDLDGNEIVSFCNYARNLYLIDGWLLLTILTDCTQILKRALTHSEIAFISRGITSRGGFMASEVIRDHVRSLSSNPEELQRYLRSESAA
jgi:hypothetical protein